jgi:hypothetical protein
MGQVPSKYFLPSAPYGSSEAANALNPVQPGAANPQTPLLPPNFQDPGTMKTSLQAPTQAATGGNPFGGNSVNRNPFSQMFGRGLFGQ